MSSAKEFVPKQFSKRLSRRIVIEPIEEATAELQGTHLEALEPQQNLVRCLYCQENDLNCLMKCSICGVVVCNSGRKATSHFYLHLKFTTHVSFKLLNYEEKTEEEMHEKKEEETEAEGSLFGVIEEDSEKAWKYKDSLINCTRCHHPNVYDMSFILINKNTKELINLKTEYSQVDELENVQKTVIFFCWNEAKPCLKQLQESLFGDSEIEEDYVRSLVNAHEKSNKFGFKEFFFNRLILADKSDTNPALKFDRFDLGDVYLAEDQRLKALDRIELKKNDYYNLIDETNEYQFYDSDISEEEEELEAEVVPSKKITSPLLNEEYNHFQDKTKGLKRITKSHLSKLTSYETFKQFAFDNMNLMYDEQFATLALSSTNRTMNNDAVLIKYKSVVFDNRMPTKIAMRLNTNHSLPVVSAGQVLGFKHVNSNRIMFTMVRQVPNNDFNPEFMVEVMTINGKPDDYSTENFFTTNGTLVPVKLESTKILDTKLFKILPFDKVFSKVIEVMFGILQSKIQLSPFLLNLILGKNFENFEFQISSFKGNNEYQANFNLSQKRAIDSLDSNKVTLVKGNAGTGKTIVCLAIIKNLINKNMKPILVCSGSNSSVDSLCETFNNNYVADSNISITRVVAPLKESFYDSNHVLGDLCFHNYILTHAPEELKDVFVPSRHSRGKLPTSKDYARLDNARLDKYYLDFFQSQDVVFSSCYNSLDSKLKKVKFKSIVIDDCSATLNVLSLLPLSRDCEKLVLIGDDKQLSPYIHNTKDCSRLRQSLFQRILHNQLVKPIILREQYRMTKKLADYPKKFIYDGTLLNGILKNSSETPAVGFPTSHPVLFWDMMNEPKYKEINQGYRKKLNYIKNFYVTQKTYLNQYEAEQIVKLVVDLCTTHGVDLKDIGIITAYVGQRVLLSQLLYEALQKLPNATKQSVITSTSIQKPLTLKTSPDFLFENHDPNEFEKSLVDKIANLEIGALESFQSKEKQFIIFSTVRSVDLEMEDAEQVKLLADYRRLNLSVTRARKGLFIIGDSQVLLNVSKAWANYLSYLYDLNCVVDSEVLGQWKSTYKLHLTYLRK